MSDFVEQLRTGNHPTCKNMYALGDPEDICCDHCSERLAAADEIERLRVTIDDLCHKLNDSEHVISEMLRITTEHKDADQ